ncbi:hypothetical protein JW916_01755 [Candidatus Sumerlaeota bacterium]|nr:hypothetical protein [Candidatus Sumerlaeota bacterium]
MKRALLAVAAICFCATQLARPEGAPGAQTLAGRSTYETDLCAFFDEMDGSYPFFDLKGIRNDWNETENRLRSRVETCNSDAEFMRLLDEAIRCLRDSHIEVHSERIEYPRRDPRFYPGIGFMPAQHAVVVMAASSDLAQRFPVGAVVRTIDGVDARECLESRAAQAWKEGRSSSPQRARLFEYRIPLRGEKGTTHTLVLDRDGESQTVVVECSVETGGWPHVYNMPPNLARVGRSASYGKMPSGVGYIYLRRVDASATQGIAQAIESHPDCPGWIVDLRGNGGGGYGRDLIEAIQRLSRPVAVLIDAGCVSAGETLARDFRRLTQARLFGSKTAGSSSAKKQWRLPSGIATLTVPVRSRWRADGKPIEFNGIDPDEEIEPSPDDVWKGLNTEILAAERYVLDHPSK